LSKLHFFGYIKSTLKDIAIPQ